ncbi:glutathione S-transferase N-terminal domain-containing protein [Candidatus Nomurabacteria bacterium]|nr:glutathione S-transferase N-terminal domain-containing protein [Candidatus Nomurabacteria bacterium]
MKEVKVYTTTYCPYCKRAKALFESLGVDYEEIDVENNQELRDQLIEKYQWQTVPLITIGEELVGGFDDISRLHGEGKLLEMVNA